MKGKWLPVVVASLAVLLASCLLYTSDAADDLLCVDLGGRRIINKKKIYFIYIRAVDIHDTSCSFV